MKITQHGDNLIQLTKWGMVNCFLVREADGFTLVDTGMGGSADAILKAAAQAGGDIARILLTHAHVDHVGSLDALHAALPAAEIMIGAREARFLRGDKSLDPAEEIGKLRGGYPDVTTQPTRELAPGDMIGSLEVHAAPGHTPGQVAYLDTRDRTLIAGDAFSTIGRPNVSGVFYWRFPVLVFATWHTPTALDTARTLRALNPARLAVGHGGTVENPGAGMDAAIAIAARKYDAQTD